mmetsp:Transcript_5016/g.9531  ORF Transcript_5016/g.9531 Transcript_5016/m.9531 type:complete len:465 (+) Transcript_5016:584-1978(+)
MNSLQHVITAIETQNWQRALHLITNDDNCRYLAMDDLYEVFERFMFGIDNEYTRADTIGEQERQGKELNDLVKKFLCRLSLYNEPLLSHRPTLVHNLCMEHKHGALKLLLRNLDPCIAAREASYCTSLCVDFVEDICGCPVYRDALFRHSPLQAAWEGFLFDHEQDHHDLTDVKGWDALWKTTVYILLAFDRQPIDFNYAFSGKWNIIHAIARYGHRAPSAVMSYALKLYPEYVMRDDDVGNLPLHVAISSCQIYYKSYRYELDQGERQLRTTYDNQLKYHVANQNTAAIQKPLHMYRNPISMLVYMDSSAASRCDPNGRLPLHSLILHQGENSKMFESITNCLGYFTRGHHFDPLSTLKYVMDANPNALEYPEPSTGLFPFLLAATSNLATSLDSIFLLLKENPAVLEASCRATFQNASKGKPSSNPRTTPTINTTSPPSVHRIKRVVSPEMWTCNKRIRKIL